MCMNLHDCTMHAGVCSHLHVYTVEPLNNRTLGQIILSMIEVVFFRGKNVLPLYVFVDQKVYTEVYFIHACMRTVCMRVGVCSYVGACL